MGIIWDRAFDLAEGGGGGGWKKLKKKSARSNQTKKSYKENVSESRKIYLCRRLIKTEFAQPDSIVPLPPPKQQMDRLLVQYNAGGAEKVP